MRDKDAPQWVLDQVEDLGAECWFWTGYRLRRHGGHGGDRAYAKVDGRTTTAARALWVAVNGSLERRELVLHSCDNPLCVRPSHLRLGSAADNARDAAERGRLRPGGRVA